MYDRVINVLVRSDSYYHRPTVYGLGALRRTFRDALEEETGDGFLLARISLPVARR